MRTLYCFDRDGTVQTSAGPVPIALVRHLGAAGHEVWCHGNQTLCQEAGIPGLVEASRRLGRNIDDIRPGQDLRRERLRSIRSLFPDLPAICVDDIDLSDLVPEGWKYYSPGAFMAAQPAEPESPTAPPPAVPLRSEQHLASRYIRADDERVEQVAGLRLPTWWWSRPYEYAWALRFSAAGGPVLDAGCGLPHPLKWALALAGDETWAVDSNPSLLSPADSAAALAADFGAAARAPTCPNLRLQVAVLEDLPLPETYFHRVFCISVLEHLAPTQRARVLWQVRRVLRPGGIAVLTVDVPAVNPQALLDEAGAAGLLPAGAVEPARPANAIYHRGWGLWVFRAALVSVA